MSLSLSPATPRALYREAHTALRERGSLPRPAAMRFMPHAQRAIAGAHAPDPLARGKAILVPGMRGTSHRVLFWDYVCRFSNTLEAMKKRHIP